jgi:hypothetical protein
MPNRKNLLSTDPYPFFLQQIPVVRLINIEQTIMQIWAMVLLFLVPKKTDDIKNEQ